MEKHSLNIVKSGEVINKEVRDKETKEKLGKIEEIVLDKLTGHTRYVVLSFGGIFGFGDKFFALPWKSISYSKEDDCFILGIDKSLLKSERGFDKDHWPDMAQWGETVDRYYKDI